MQGSDEAGLSEHACSMQTQLIIRQCKQNRCGRDANFHLICTRYETGHRDLASYGVSRKVHRFILARVPDRGQ